MADFTKTITNSVNLFGGGPSTKWGQSNLPYTMTWGTQKWGEGSFSIVFSVQKLIENQLSPDSTVTKQVRKLIENALSFDQDMSSEIMNNGVWRIVFVSDTINVEDRDSATWTSLSASAVSFTCQAAGSTTWT